MRNFVLAICVASSLTVGLSAQAEPPATQSQQPVTQAQPAPRNPQPAPPAQQPATTQLTKTTVGGCIQNAPPAAPAAGATTSTPAAASASRFDLANAKIVTPAPVGTAGTSTPAVRYRLEGDEKLITPHLNHQVEITGTVSPAAGNAVTAAPTLKVESVKMVAAACPPSR
jgi:hypothetical protein